MSANDIPPALNENSHWRGLNTRVAAAGSMATLEDNCENTPKSPSNPENDDVILLKLAKCLENIQSATSRQEKSKKKSRYELDTYARIIFPVSFVLFNVIYWSVWPIEL